MQISNSISNNHQTKQNFKGFSPVDVIGNIESNILLNKGITDLGGMVIPQSLMSNNRDESVERAFKGCVYGAVTFISPFLLLPLFNKTALSHFCKLKNLKPDEKKIIEVSKKYLTKDGKYLEKGIREKSKELFGHENGFDNILNKYDDKEKLRKDLINVHASVLCADFLTTNLMVASNPWLANLLTKHRTNRSGYSGTYVMADEDFTKKDADKHAKTKKLRQGATILFATLPALIFPPLLKKGLTQGSSATNKVLKFFNKNADKFDYKNSIYMSRLTAFIMWATSMFLPLQLACRDKYEHKDAIIRGSAIGMVFWGGDLFLRKCFAKMSDKFLGTKLIDKETNKAHLINDFKNYKNIDSLKNIPENVIKRSRNAAVGLNVLNMGIVMSTLGFGIPFALNKILKKRVSEDKSKMMNSNFVPKNNFEAFETFKDTLKQKNNS